MTKTHFPDPTANVIMAEARLRGISRKTLIERMGWSTARAKVVLTDYEPLQEYERQLLSDIVGQTAEYWAATDERFQVDKQRFAENEHNARYERDGLT